VPVLRTRIVVWPIIGASVFCAALTVGPLGAQLADGRFDAAAYWRRPLAPQGAPPGKWSTLEQSLRPEDCGQCHRDQFEQWRTSLHAHAFSPGLVADALTYTAVATAECMQCHAPLAEQHAAFENARGLGMAHRPDQQGLAAAGNVCAGCHLRHYARFGPPQRGTGAVGPSKLTAPHGGVFRTTFFESVEFCSSCHQFDAAFAVNGKPLQNTVAEWQASPQASQGVTCQTCHMPDRQHLWRGIHDPAMVASGLAPHITADATGVRFEITNTGVGHAFPTYATPKVVMYAQGLDPAGAPQPEALRKHVIARDLRYENDHWIEVSDSRLLPGHSAVIELPWNASERIQVWLQVIPDNFYETEIYPDRLARASAGSAVAQLIMQAEAVAAKRSFRIFETELRRP
jgi:Cytochrome c554 and c-prime